MGGEEGYYRAGRSGYGLWRQGVIGGQTLMTAVGANRAKPHSMPGPAVRPRVSERHAETDLDGGHGGEQQLHLAHVRLDAQGAAWARASGKTSRRFTARFRYPADAAASAPPPPPPGGSSRFLMRTPA